MNIKSVTRTKLNKKSSGNLLEISSTYPPPFILHVCKINGGVLLHTHLSHIQYICPTIGKERVAGYISTGNRF